MNKEILKEIGLTNTEIEVYLSLLEIGQSLASKISQKAKVERAVTYHTLENLIRKGIVSYVIKENRKYFSAAEPEKLHNLIKEKEDLLDEIMPELKKLKSSAEQELGIEVFRGKDGFKTVMEDLIREKEPYYIIGYTGKGTEIAPFWYIHWNKRRAKNKVKRYLLIKEGDEKLDALNFPLTSVKVLPRELIQQSKSSIIVYGKNKVLLFLPLSTFAGIRIENKENRYWVDG